MIILKIPILNKLYSQYFHESLIIKKPIYYTCTLKKPGSGSGAVDRREPRNKQTNRNERKSIND